jgi:hypothetical protein
MVLFSVLQCLTGIFKIFRIAFKISTSLHKNCNLAFISMDTVSIVLLQAVQSNSSVCDSSGWISMVCGFCWFCLMLFCLLCLRCLSAYWTFYLKWLAGQLIWDPGSSSREALPSFSQHLRTWTDQEQELRIFYRTSLWASTHPFSRCTPMESVPRAEGRLVLDFYFDGQWGPWCLLL